MSRRSLDLTEVARFIQEHIGPEFHDKKLAKLKVLTLESILRRKNPYLFKAKRTQTANDFIKAVLDATVSSGEETVFGNFLEKVAIHVCQQIFGGRKSGIKGLDLEFEDGRDKYLVSIKSGPNWGNDQQIKAMIRNFHEARKTLHTSGGGKNLNIRFVEGCCYGRDNSYEKGTHQKLCGQRFWELISGGSETLYTDIIEPIGHKAKERNEELEEIYTAKLNDFTAQFVTRFCQNGLIDWISLVDYNSGKQQ
ncbi:MAG: hypothetical protein M9884_06830 [Rhodocyclaceae bacterium]|nr:hypothetical protein [Rhodocyclaceae bacterium]MCP5297341.1 cytosolic protein [Zoogloeaceae bacterium]